MSALALQRLDGAEAAAMIQHVSGRRRLAPAVLASLVERASGVPLFVEELAKGVLAAKPAGMAEGNDAVATFDCEVPPTLRDSLLARLDRIPSAREVAQVAAVVGREFSSAVVAAAMRADGDWLHAGLRELIDAELIQTSGSPRDERYAFRHALLQEVAYGSLAAARRRALHAAVAAEVAYAADADPHGPEIVAHHYTAAEDPDQAVTWWERAGLRAARRGESAEAIAHLRTAIELVTKLPAGVERANRELALQIALGTPLMVTQGYATPAVEAVFRRAQELCREVGETPQLFSVLWGLWSFYVVRGDHREALQLARQLVRLSTALDDRDAARRAHHAMGASLLWHGDLRPAHDHLTHAVASAESDVTPAFLAAGDSVVACLGYDAWALWTLGDADRALSRAAECGARADASGDPFTRAYAAIFVAALHQMCGDAAACAVHAETAIALSAEHGFAQWHAIGTTLSGWSMAARGSHETGISAMLRGLEQMSAIGSELAWSYHRGLLADAYCRAADWKGALAALEAADAVARKNAEGW